jgi:CheY-like chemotaxis protein
MRGIVMSLSGWAFPTAAAAIVGFGLFGIYSNIAPSYIDTTKSANAKSTPKPVIPVLVPGDEEPSALQQSSDVPTSALLPTPIQSPSSEDTKPPSDPWQSESMEAALREPFTKEPTKPDEVTANDEAAIRDGLLRDAFSDHVSLPENPVPSKMESLSSENPAVYSNNPTQLSAGQYTKATPQSVPILGSPPDPPKVTAAPSPPPETPKVTAASSSPPPETSSPQSIDHKAGKASNKMKRVLIVEDPRTHSEALTMMLDRESDLKVAGQTSSVAECRNFVGGEKGSDVLLVDLLRPDDQGTNLVEGLRNSCPHTPMLVLTMSLDPLDHERVMKAGADAVLSKSASPDEIASTLRRL